MDSRDDKPVTSVAHAETIETEETLVQRTRDGDSDAFGKLVERHMKRAYFAALGLVGSPDDALDLSQEAFARAYRARRRLDPSLPFYGWIYQILRRLCFNFTRDRRTRQLKLREAAPWLVEQAAARSRESDPARVFEAKRNRGIVLEAIEKLPGREREMLVLKEFEGLTYREIAALVGVPIGTVMSRLYTARRRLAAALEGQR